LFFEKGRTIVWIAIALAVAGGAAASDIFFSQKRLEPFSPLAKAWAARAGTIPLLACFVVVQGIPAIAAPFWMFVTINAALDALATFFLMRGLALAPISQTMPIMALTPAFMIVTAPLLTNDVLTPAGLVGVGVVSIGVYATQHPGRDHASGAFGGFWSPIVAVARNPGARAMFFAAALFAVTRALDRSCIEVSSGPWYLLVEHALLAVILGGAIVIRRIMKRESEATAPQPAKSAAPLLVLGGSVNAVAFLLHVWALEFMSVPYLIAVKRTSIILSSLWGYLVRKERAPHWYHIMGVVLAVAGVALIALYGKK
jgi:drug/metabolite transporter (DMT)-like permease